MALGLTLTAPLAGDRRLSPSAARDWLARAAVWFEAVGDAVLDAHLDRDAEGRPHLRVRCHSVGDPIDLKIATSGRLKLIAKTTPVGPGYHAYLCELLRQFAADFEFTWDPPPGDHDPGFYFLQRDRDRLDNLFRHWLASRCSLQLSKLSDGGGIVSIGLPRNHHFGHPGPVLTPLGPHSLNWLRQVAGDETAGFEFFAWRNPVLDAWFYKGRALARLWLDFPYRAPLTEDEGEMTDQIAADLANALDADETIELPWNAWMDVIRAIEADGGRHTVEPIAPELRDLIRERAGPKYEEIGYRRFPMRVPLTEPWSIEVPGDFATRWSDDGLTWSAWDGPRTVWFRSLAVQGQSAAEALAVGRGNLPRGEPGATNLHRSVLGEAVFGPHTEDGQLVHRLSCIAAADGQLAACNIYVKDPNDKDWAIRTWQSLRND